MWDDLETPLYVKVPALILAVAVVVLMAIHVMNSVIGPEEVQALRNANAGHVLTPSEEAALGRVQRP